MKTVELFRWRVQDLRGKWHTTRFDASEDQIRKDHPEAVCLEHTRVTREVPETEAEFLERIYSPALRLPQH